MASPSPRHREHYYEPSPRFNHYTARAGGKLYTWGGRTQEFSDIGKMLLQSAIEIFDPYLEVWDQQATKGDPPPGLYGGECAAIEESMYVCFGNDGKKLHSTIHKFDTTKLEWKQVQIQNPSGGPSAKSGFGMVAYQGDKLVIFAGHGISTGSVQHGASFVKSSDSTGWSNEFHLINLKEGIWSSPPTTGEKPPPCSAFSFTAIDDHRAVFFGGYQRGHRKVNDVYILDLQTMHWRKLSIAGRGPLPDARSAHSACCINFGEEHPQMLVTGGRNNDNDTLKDAWLLDIDSESWKELPLPDNLPARWGHTTTAFSLAPGLAEVAMFGGSPKFIRGARSDDEFPQVAETIVLQLESVEVTPSSREWVLVGVADKSQLGTPERVQEKMEKVQQRAITVEEKDITPEERAMRATREEIEEANRRAQEARKKVEDLQKALEESQAKVRQLSEEKERAVQKAAEQIEETRGRTREVERQLQTKEDEARMQQQQVDSFRRQLASKEDQRKREKQQAAKVPSLERLLHSREDMIKGMQEQVSSLKQQLDSKEEEIGKKELEVILLQHNLKGREDEVKEKEEEMRMQQEEKHQLTTQMQSLQFQMSESEKQFEEERGELLKDVQAGIILMQQLEQKLGRKRMSPPFPGSFHLPTVQYPIAAPIQEAEVQQRVTDPTEHVEMADFKHESPREVTEDATVAPIQEAEVPDPTEHVEMLQFQHESPRKVKAEATEQGSEPIQLRQETASNQQQEIIQEQKEHIEQQKEHMGELWKQVDQLQEVLTTREAELHHLRSQAQMSTWRELTDSSPQGYLRGFEVIAERNFHLTPHSQSYDWREYGFKLHVPEGSLQAGVTQTTVSVRVSLSGQFKFPTSSSLVSAVYWLSCPDHDTFMKPLVIDIEHCTAITAPSHCSQLSFVINKHMQRSIYEFKELKGGKFSMHSSYGSISLTSFSRIAVILTASSSGKRFRMKLQGKRPKIKGYRAKRLQQYRTQRNRKIDPHTMKRILDTHKGIEIDRPVTQYCAQLYNVCMAISSWKVHFVITRDLATCNSVVKQEYKHRVYSFAIEFKQDKISLKIPSDGLTVDDKWDIVPLFPPEIKKYDVDQFKHNKGIPECVLVAHWSRKDEPPACLLHKVALLGADKNFFRLYIEELQADDLISSKFIPTGLQQPQADDISENFTPTDFSKYSGIQAEPELADLLNEVAAIIPNQWYAVGIQLKLSDEELCSWRDSNPHARTEQLFSAIFREWKSRSVMKYSWATIIKILKTRSVNRFELANKLDTKLKR